MKPSERRTIIVGIFIFVGLVVLMVGVLAIGKMNKSFTKKIAVTAIFDDVGGLQQGNNIWYSGMKIGIVRDLQFYKGSQVQVLMNIDQKAQPHIHQNAFAKISTDGLLGNKIIVLYGGTPESPMVQNGDQLAVEKAISTDDMLKTLQENNVNIASITTDFKVISKKIADGQGSLGKLLNDDALYNNLELMVGSLKLASDNAKQVTASLADYTAKLHQEGTLANDLVTDTTVFKNLKSTMDQLNAIAANANQVVNNLKTASSDTTSPLGILLHDQQSGSSMKATIKNLETGSQLLNEDLEAMQHNFLLRGYFKKEEKKAEKAQ